MASNLQQDTRPGPPATAKGGWTPGRIVALAAGSVLALACLALLGGAGLATWADTEHGGYLATGTATYSTAGYALAGDPVSLPGGWGWPGRIAGKVRIRVTPAGPGTAVFAGIAPAGAVQRYLAGASYTAVTALGGDHTAEHPGTAVPAPSWPAATRSPSTAPCSPPTAWNSTRRC